MSLNTIIYELIRFIKDNIIKIVLGALAISLLLTGGKYYVDTRNQTDDDLVAAYESLLTVYEQEPAEFKFIVQNDDGTLFDNSFIIDEYLAHPKGVEQIESLSGVSIKETLEQEKQLGLHKTSQFRGGMAVIRDTSTNLLTARVQIAPTAEENLAVTKAIKQLIEELSIPFLEDKEVVIFQEPSIGETIDQEANALADPLGELEAPEISGGFKLLVRYALLGLVAGGILTTGLLFVFQLLSRKIYYAFEYSWDLNDQHLLYQENKYPTLTLHELINLPHVHQRLVLDQETKNTQGEWIKGIQDFSQTPLVDEVVLIIRQDKTTKSWYDEQYSLAKLYRCPLRIIHVVE